MEISRVKENNKSIQHATILDDEISCMIDAREPAIKLVSFGIYWSDQTDNAYKNNLVALEVLVICQYRSVIYQKEHILRITKNSVN